MAHPEQLDFVKCIKQHFPGYFENSRVLEIGSLDINGSVRSQFTGCDYTGVDVAQGNGVDLVCEGQMLDLPTGSFDTVISCEAMEHNPYWVETTANMFRLCRKGGIVIMSCATHGRREHGTTRTNPYDSPLTLQLGWDYYKNLSEHDFLKAFPLDLWFSSFKFFRNWNSYDLLFFGVRSGTDSPPDLTSLANAISQQCIPKNKLLILRRQILVALFGDTGLYRIRRMLERI